MAAAFLASDAPEVTTLGRVILQCYYRDDRVVRSLGLEPRPPFPKGHTLEQGDWSLLDPVRARPKLWRDAPEATMTGPRNDIVDVLIIGSGASGAAVAWSLAETRMKILCLEQGDWMKPSDFPSNGRDWEARRYADFDISPNRRGAADGLPDQRRQLADEGGQLQRRRRRHHPVHRAFPADAPVGFPGAHAGRRGGRLADRLSRRWNRFLPRTTA